LIASPGHEGLPDVIFPEQVTQSRFDSQHLKVFKPRRSVRLRHFGGGGPESVSAAFFAIPTKEKTSMDIATKKRLEEQLRQLILSAEAAKDESSPPAATRRSGVQVIRRRKGAPDRKIG
jgi:hypothetical protein